MKSRAKIIISIIVLFLLVCGTFGAALVMQQSKLRAEQEAAEQAAAQIEPLTQQKEKDQQKRLDELAASHVYSHRGASSEEIEHTIASYDRAIAYGSQNIEQDLVISADGTLYVSHDESAARITGVNAAYSSMSDEQIDQLRTSDGQKILKLSEVFEKYGKKVNYIIELKNKDTATIDAFRKTVEEYDMADQVVVQCFQLDVLQALEEYFPDMLKLHLSKQDQWSFENALTKDYVDIVSVDATMMSEANCEAAHENGKKFNVWTLDTEDAIRQAIDIGVDTYFTNETDRAIALEKKYRHDPLATLFFASDYQAQTGWDPPKETLEEVLEEVNKDCKTPDEVIICGDYSNDRTLHDYQISPEDAIGEIKSTVTAECPDVEKNDILFVQGNHDKLTKSIAKSGLHEFDDYLVYVMNTENDFPWKQGKTQGSLVKVKKSAARMQKCFDQLIQQGETRPVIIAGHVPLHYSGRTSSMHKTGDNLYSSLIFDVVNEAAGSLNILYLYGHNHTKGWDCYLGMSCVYKPVGDQILIPEFTKRDLTSDSYTVEQLNFTYMNAGYIGHCMNCSPDEVDAGTVDQYEAADDTLTGTACEIYPEKLVLTRYSEDGVYQLSSAGCASPYYDDSKLIPEEYYSKQIDSPKNVKYKSDMVQ